MTSEMPLSESDKKTLDEIKQFAEIVLTFSENIGPPGERRFPIVLFVKNYLRYYSTSLIDQVIDLEFRDSFPLFEKTRESLMDAYHKLEATYSSTFQDEQIAEYAQLALKKAIIDDNN